MNDPSGWAQALLQTLLPERADPGAIVLLACEEETVTTAGALLGHPPECALASLINEATGGRDLRWAADRVLAFERAAPPREVPAFLPALCVCVLAASRMGEGSTSGREYYQRLGETLGVPPGPGSPPFPGFDVLSTRGFATLADWLARDEHGRRGELWFEQSPARRFVGPSIAQALLRGVDRRTLGSFFQQHARALSAGWDPVRLLSTSGARHLLTRAAQDTLADPARRAPLAAALRAAFAAWDGSVQDVDGSRVLASHLLARLIGGQLTLSVCCEALGEEEPGQSVEGPVRVPAAPGEFTVPLTWLAPAAVGPVNIELTGRRRLRALPGPSVLFAVTPLGLEAVQLAGPDPVWLLTCEPALAERLPPESVVPARLPDGWSLYAEIDPSLLDEGMRASDAGEVASGGGLDFSGGLPLGDSAWLVTDPPLLAAELTDPGQVEIDGRPAGTLLPGRSFDLRLLRGKAGTHQIRVGPADGQVELCERGLREGYGTIGHALRDGVAPPHGARRFAEQLAVGHVVGALIEGDQPRRAPQRVFVRLRGTVELIEEDGTVRSCYPPRPGRWAEELDVQGGGGHWPLPDGERAIWACSLRSPRPRALLLRGDATPRLTGDLAALLGEIGDCQVEDLAGAGDAQQRWQLLLKDVSELENSLEAGRG